MIAAINLSKSYGAQPLFEDVSFSVNAGERVGLVGRNGHGKTTLLRIIIGEEQTDGGEIAVPRNYRVGYVSQHLMFAEETVLAEACRGLPEHAHGETWMAEKILSGLGFARRDMARPWREFSGGYQVRLNLARTLASEPNLLLLDEPTNYLDMDSSDALMAAVDEFEGAVVMVTHNEMFLHTLANRFVVFQAGGVSVFEGSYQSFLDTVGWEDERAGSAGSAGSGARRGERQGGARNARRNRFPGDEGDRAVEKEDG